MTDNNSNIPVEKIEDTFKLRGHIKIYEAENPDNVLYEEHNVIVNIVKILFSRLMANSVEPQYGIWGLAIGSGNPSWGSNPPAETPTQTALVNETKRKKATLIRFLDPTSLAPISSGFSSVVEVQTLFNATTDNITQPIQEMGLIGGGTVTPLTNMSTASYWNLAATSGGGFVDTTAADANSVILINYKTLAPLTLPAGLSIIIAWQLQF